MNQEKNYTRKVVPRGATSKTQQTFEGNQERLTCKVAGWVKPTKTGKEYISLKLQFDHDTLQKMLETDRYVLNVNIFENKFAKENEKAPSYKSIDEQVEQ